jgi:hypothetical protein
MSDIQNAAVIVTYRSSVLLFQQDYGRHSWVCPGGKIEHGQTPVDAAYNECIEETGFHMYLNDEEKIRLRTLIEQSKNFIHESDHVAIYVLNIEPIVDMIAARTDEDFSNSLKVELFMRKIVKEQHDHYDSIYKQTKLRGLRKYTETRDATMIPVDLMESFCRANPQGLFKDGHTCEIELRNVKYTIKDFVVRSLYDAFERGLFEPNGDDEPSANAPEPRVPSTHDNRVQSHLNQINELTKKIMELQKLSKTSELMADVNVHDSPSTDIHRLEDVMAALIDELKRA